MDTTLLHILACPDCNGPLEPHENSRKLLCRCCGLTFPVVNGIPVLLRDAVHQVKDTSQ